MKYYKLIRDNEFIGICTTLDMRKFQKKHNIFLVCNETEAQYVQCAGKMYRATWMIPGDSAEKDIPIVDVIEIEQSEYDALYNAIKSNEEIKIELDSEQDENEESQEIDKPTQVTIEYVCESKITEMKHEFDKTISNGLDIEVSVGKKHHFPLTVQDQLNLITAAQKVNDGEQLIQYYTDGEFFEYSASEMRVIIDKVYSFKKYHEAYFNSLKNYIKSLQDVNNISDIFYGVDIPEEYQSKILKSFK